MNIVMMTAHNSSESLYLPPTAMLQLHYTDIYFGRSPGGSDSLHEHWREHFCSTFLDQISDFI